MSNRSVIPAELWEAQKSTIVDMYINRKQTVNQIAQVMKAHGLDASKQQYAKQFKKWGASKNSTSRDWKYISKALHGRLPRASTVLIHGLEIPGDKVRKETQRYDLPRLMPQSPTPEAMDHIIIRTPGVEADSISSFPNISYENHLNAAVADYRAPAVLASLGTLPTIEFMDFLDQNLSDYANVLRDTTSMPLIYAKDFVTDVRNVAQYCDFSLRLLGHESPGVAKSLESGDDQYIPQKRLHGAYSKLLSKTTPVDQPLPALLQLFKVVVSLSVNHTLQLTKDDALQDLQYILQEVDPLDQFMGLIAKYDLYSIFQKVLELHTIVTDMLASESLHCAVELGDDRLLRLLLQIKCPLNRRELCHGPRSSFCCKTALSKAAMDMQDLSAVKLLLEAGADPYGALSFLCDPERMPDCWHDAEMSEAQLAIIQCLLDAMLERYEEGFREIWRFAIEAAFLINNFELCRKILDNFVSLLSPYLQEEGRNFIAVVSTNNASAFTTLACSQKSLLAWFCRDPKCKVLARGLLCIVIMHGDQDMLRCFKRFGPDLLALSDGKVHDFLMKLLDFAHWRTPLGLKDFRTTCTLRTLDVFMEHLPLSSKDKICGQSFNADCFEATALMQATGARLHDHELTGKRGSCPLQTHRLYTSQLWGSIILRSAQEGKEATLCCINVVARYGDLALLQQIINGVPNGRELLQTPEFFLELLCVGNEEIFLWLVSSKLSFSVLNQALADYLNDFQWNSKPCFSGTPDLLSLAFSNGLATSRGLLIMCALSCSTDSIENMRFVTEMARKNGCPFSREDFTICLNTIIDRAPMLAYFVEHHTKCECTLYEDIFLDSNHFGVKSLTFLAEQGAIARDPKWQYLLRFEAETIGAVILKMFRSQESDPLIALVKTSLKKHPSPLLQSIVNRFFHDEYVDAHDTIDHWMFGYMTPLQLAAGVTIPDIRVVRALIEKGANVNAPAHKQCGLTALQAAASVGNFEVALELVQSGADINEQPSPNTGQTALEAAAVRGHIDMIHLFVINNPDPTRLRVDCKRAARLARWQGDDIIARMLEEHARKLAKQLDVPHEDDVDRLCICQIKRRG